MSQLLSNLPVGSFVKFGKHSVGSESPQPIVWVVAAKNHKDYNLSNSVTLLAKQIIDLRAFDGVEPSMPTGNPKYTVSNMHIWLNSDASAGAWYNAAHEADTPPNTTNVTSGTEYANRPGFLFNFANSERSAILPTTIKANWGYTSLTTKVFLPSTKEMGSRLAIDEGGTTFAYIQSVGGGCTATSQVINYTLSATKPTSNDTWDYWLRQMWSSGDYPFVMRTTGAGEMQAYYGHIGVRPIINLSGDMLISSITDDNGCYTFSITNAPSMVVNLRLTTATVYTNKPCTIQWSDSNHPNGDAFSYKVHTYYDNVEYGEPINVGTNTSYTLPVVKYGVSTIKFGVEAIDIYGHSSGINTVEQVVHTNYAPIISGANGSIGEKKEAFSHSYNVADSEGNTVSVTEYIDNVKIRSYVATLNENNNFAVTGETWLKLSNGVHTLKIVATDGVEEAVRTLTFTKSVTKLVVQRVSPVASDIEPKRLIVTVAKIMPPDATFLVEACNNGFEATPTWHDITESVLKGQVFLFPETSVKPTKWGVNIRVTIDRNKGEGACYITEIGGNFE